MKYLFPSLIILILLAFLNIESFKTPQEASIIGRWDKYYPYCSSNISAYDIGSPNVKNIYNYWKNRPLHWQTEYAAETSPSIDNVKSTRDKHLPYRKTVTKGVDPMYYHDPSNYTGTMFYPETYMPHQEPVDKVSTANNRVLEGLHYNGIAILQPLDL